MLAQPVRPTVPRLAADRSTLLFRRLRSARLRLRRSTAAGRRLPRGWSTARQHRFLAALARHDTVSAAAATVRASRQEALAERSRDPAFRRAWDEAANATIYQLETVLLDRAIHGVAEPVLHAGARVTEKRRFNDALGMWILATRLPERYGRRPAGRDAGDAAPADLAAPAVEPPAGEEDLDAVLERIARRIEEAERAMKENDRRAPRPDDD